VKVHRCKLDAEPLIRPRGPPSPTRGEGFALLHDARPVLLDLGAPGGLDIAGWPAGRPCRLGGRGQRRGPCRRARRLVRARGRGV